MNQAEVANKAPGGLKEEVLQYLASSDIYLAVLALAILFFNLILPLRIATKHKDLAFSIADMGAKIMGPLDKCIRSGAAGTLDICQKDFEVFPAEKKLNDICKKLRKSKAAIVDRVFAELTDGETIRLKACIEAQFGRVLAGDDTYFL